VLLGSQPLVAAASKSSEARLTRGWQACFASKGLAGAECAAASSAAAYSAAASSAAAYSAAASSAVATCAAA